MIESVLAKAISPTATGTFVSLSVFHSYLGIRTEEVGYSIGPVISRVQERAYSPQASCRWSSNEVFSWKFFKNLFQADGLLAQPVRRAIVAEDVLVHEFHKSADEMVRATIGEFRGRKTVGIRIFYEDVDGDWKPTKKGITLSAELFPELKKAVEMIEAGLQQEEQKDPSADGE